MDWQVGFYTLDGGSLENPFISTGDSIPSSRQMFVTMVVG